MDHWIWDWTDCEDSGNSADYLGLANLSEAVVTGEGEDLEVWEPPPKRHVNLKTFPFYPPQVEVATIPFAAWKSGEQPD